MPQKVTLDLNKLYKKLCPRCQEVIRAMVKEQVTDDMIRQQLEKEDK